MTSTLAPPDAADLGGYETHLDDIRSALATVPRVTPDGTFPGGAFLRVDADYRIAMLLPPYTRAEQNLYGYLGGRFDGHWLVAQHERIGSVELVHLIYQPANQ